MSTFQLSYPAKFEDCLEWRFNQGNLQIRQGHSERP